MLRKQNKKTHTDIFCDTEQTNRKLGIRGKNQKARGHGVPETAA